MSLLQLTNTHSLSKRTYMRIRKDVCSVRKPRNGRTKYLPLLNTKVTLTGIKIQSHAITNSAKQIEIPLPILLSKSQRSPRSAPLVPRPTTLTTTGSMVLLSLMVSTNLRNKGSLSWKHRFGMLSKHLT